MPTLLSAADAAHRTAMTVPGAASYVRARLYRAVAAEVPAPLLLWLHGGAFVGGTPDDIDVANAGLALATDLSGLPPALVIGAGRDAVRDDARRYAARLGATASYVEYADAPHAFLNFPRAEPVAWRALDDIAAYVGRSIR